MKLFTFPPGSRENPVPPPVGIRGLHTEFLCCNRAAVYLPGVLEALCRAASGQGLSDLLVHRSVSVERGTQNLIGKKAPNVSFHPMRAKTGLFLAF